jgi:hypothetical protein
MIEILAQYRSWHWTDELVKVLPLLFIIGGILQLWFLIWFICKMNKIANCLESIAKFQKPTTVSSIKSNENWNKKVKEKIEAEKRSG